MNTARHAFGANDRPDLAVVAEDEAREDQAKPPLVFSRAIATPPGLPWEQSQAALLEARLSAPLALTELAFQVRRLEAWAPGRPGRFGAFYVRRGDVGEGLEELVLVDGAWLRVRFDAPHVTARRRKVIAGIALGVGLGAVVIVTALGAALSARSETEQHLTRLEAQVTRRLRVLSDRDHQLAQARALESSGLADRDIDHVLADLSWVASNKSDDVRLLSWYWDRGVMAVEVRSPASPFPTPDRPIQRGAATSRRGVSIYGIGPAKASSAVSRTTATSADMATR